MDSPEPQTFGERMLALKRERGLPLAVNAGRKPIAERFRPQIAAAERAFAVDMPAEAKRYVDELAPKEPERCEVHNRVLCCPASGCATTSQRTKYDHKAAAYVFDRIMGKPTTRLETSVTIQLVEQLTTQFVVLFGEVNGIADADARRAAFADGCRQVGVQWGSGAA